jgi:hypothetical protein
MRKIKTFNHRGHEGTRRRKNKSLPRIKTDEADRKTKTLKHGGKEEAEERNDRKTKAHRGDAETRRTAEIERIEKPQPREAAPHECYRIGKEKTTGEGAGATRVS